MKIKLNIQGIKSIDPSNHWWWKNTQIIEDCISFIQETKLLKFNFFYDHDRYVKFESIQFITDYYENNFGHYGCTFSITAGKTEEINALKVYINESVINIELLLDFIHEQSQVNSLVKVVTNLQNLYREKVLLGPDVNISFPDLDFLRFKPIRNYWGLNSHAIINFLSPQYFEVYDSWEKPMNLEILFSDKLPKGATREEKFGLINISWANNIKNYSELENSLLVREEFIYRELCLEPIIDFNELGHKRIFNISALEKTPEKESFFRYYNPRTEMAFKLITLTDKKDLNEDTKTEITETLKSRLSKTGKLTVSKIVLILPSQSSALSIEERALALGVYKVLYMDNEADLWDMRPNGNWRD